LTVVCAACVGVFAEPSLPVDPFGLDLPVVGPRCRCPARTLEAVRADRRPALLSMNAFDSVTNTATATPAPEPADDESALVETFVFTFDVMPTSPVAVVIRLVPESWLARSRGRTWRRRTSRVLDVRPVVEQAVVRARRRPCC
jgi:hypothetical protein